MQGKKCNLCGVYKDISNYHKAVKNKDAFDCRCKECKAELYVIYRGENSEKIRKKRQVFYYENRGRLNKHSRDHQKNNAAHVLEYQKKHRVKLYNTDPVFRDKTNCTNKLNAMKNSPNPTGKVYEKFGYSARALKMRLLETANLNNCQKNLSINHIIPVAILNGIGIFDPKIVHNLINIEALTLGENKKRFTHLTEEAVGVARRLSELFAMPSLLSDIIALKEKQDALYAMNKGAKRGK